MDVTFLVPIVVLLQVALQQAPSADNRHGMPLLQDPKLAVYPGRPNFEGERVELICSAPPNRTAEGYRFFSQSGGQILETAPDAYQQGKLAFHVQMDSTGTYTCDYWIKRDGTKLTSAQSNAISLQVKEAPAAPSLSLAPNLDAYRWDDTVSLTCSAPFETRKVMEFQYYGDRMVTLAVASSPTYVRNLTLKEPNHGGPFQCAYVQKHFGRPVVSKKSNLVFINVMDGVGWVHMLAVGGSFFTINGLIFLLSHCIFLKDRRS